MDDELFEEKLKMPETKIVEETTFKSFIHNNEICEEIVKWSKENNHSIEKAKFYKELKAYIGFGEGFFIEPEYRIIALNVDESGEINTYIARMMKEYENEGLKMILNEEAYNTYGALLRDLKVVGHPVLINAFEDFVENMR